MTPDLIHSLPFGDKPRIDLSGLGGVLAIVPTEPGEQPFLEASETLSRVFKPTITREGDTVRVRFDVAPAFPSAFWDFGPKVQVTLHVPPAVQGKFHLDAGRIRARGLTGCDLELQTGAGVLALREVSGKVRLRAGAGKITAEKLSGSIDVETNAGAIRLAIDKLASGKHRVHSSMGSIRVELAPDQKLQIEARATMGSVRTGFRSSPGAEATLQLETEFGSIRVEEAGHGGSGEEERGFAWQWPASAGARKGWGFGHSPWSPPAQPASDDELKRILTMVKDGKLTPEEAQQLLRAMEHPKR